MIDLSSAVLERNPAITIAIGIIAAAILLPKLLASNPIGNLPFLGLEHGGPAQRERYFMRHGRELYQQGYKKFRNSLYRLTTADGEHIVLPLKFLPELRNKPDDEISMSKALGRSLESKYSGLEGDSPLLNHVVRADLTPGLTKINPQLSAEVTYTVKTELPPCDDWTSVHINGKLLRIVAIVSGSIFLGPELCRNEEYVHASINFTVDVFRGIAALKNWRSWLPWYGVYFTPELQRLNGHNEKARKFLAPVIRQRREAMARGEQMTDDVLQWMLNKSDKFGVTKVDDIARSQLLLSMAAIHTTTATATNILYDLVAMPELIEPLRAEIRDVLKENDGVMTTHALYNMKLLDSVMRESMRVNPLGCVRFTRIVDKPIALSDGTVLPRASTVTIPSDAISQDPSIYPNPEKFDAWRFYNLRKDGAENNQCVTVSSTSLQFGYGRHACPGRFFAVNEIKLILANILLHYDVKMKDGRAERYPNIPNGAQFSPDPRKELLFRRVQT